jgi:XTP/dITP diphosphohydrolase
VKVVFASRNRHKTEQVARLLPELELVTLDEVAPDLELEEPFDTFEANALNKARMVVAATGLPAIADDSGLEVDALGGAPGVYSARYAGEVATDRENNQKLIAALQGIPEEQWTCRYRCVAAAVLPGVGDIVTQGSCEGRVVAEPRGTLGFGYDPHVIPIPDPAHPETRTMGEIPLDEKLRFSHRGLAFSALREKLTQAL